MAELLDVDHSPNGRWYFYWKFNGVVYRTIGVSYHGDSYSPATPVEINQALTLHGNVVGIAFNDYLVSDGRHTPIVTYYADGFFNSSDLSLNLQVP